MQTFTVNVEHIILFFYLNAHFPKTGDGGQTVRAFQKVSNFCNTVRQRTEHNRTVGDGFVAGNGDGSF